MTIRTIQMPDGTIMRYDDRFIPEKVDVGEQQKMGLLGSAAGTGLSLAGLYGASKMGLLGGGKAAGSGAIADVGSVGANGATAAGTTATADALPAGVGGNAGEYAGSLAGDATAGSTSFFTGNGLFDSGAMGYGDYIPGVAGAIGTYDLIANKRRGARGVAQGALSGAGIGYSLGGPVGAGIGAIIGSGLGLSQAAKSTKEKQADRWKAAGHEGMADEYASHDYLAGTPGEETREEKYLTADAIKNNPDNYNNVKDWDSWSDEDKNKYLQTLLDNHAVQESRGGVYYRDDYAQRVADAIRNKQEIPTLEESQRVW